MMQVVGGHVKCHTQQSTLQPHWNTRRSNSQHDVLLASDISKTLHKSLINPSTVTSATNVFAQIKISKTTNKLLLCARHSRQIWGGVNNQILSPGWESVLSGALASATQPHIDNQWRCCKQTCRDVSAENIDLSNIYLYQYSVRINRYPTLPPQIKITNFLY